GRPPPAWCDRRAQERTVTALPCVSSRTTHTSTSRTERGSSTASPPAPSSLVADGSSVDHKGWEGCAALRSHTCHQEIVIPQVYAVRSGQHGQGDVSMAREPDELVEMRRVLGA